MVSVSMSQIQFNRKSNPLLVPEPFVWNKTVSAPEVSVEIIGVVNESFPPNDARSVPEVPTPL